MDFVWRIVWTPFAPAWVILNKGGNIARDVVLVQEQLYDDMIGASSLRKLARERERERKREEKERDKEKEKEKERSRALKCRRLYF